MCIDNGGKHPGTAAYHVAVEAMKSLEIEVKSRKDVVLTRLEDENRAAQVRSHLEMSF